MRQPLAPSGFLLAHTCLSLAIAAPKRIRTDSDTNFPLCSQTSFGCFQIDFCGRPVCRFQTNSADMGAAAPCSVRIFAGTSPGYPWDLHEPRHLPAATSGCVRQLLFSEGFCCHMPGYRGPSGASTPASGNASGSPSI